MPDIELQVAGKNYSGWKSVDIKLGIEELAGSFELRVSEVAPNGDAAAVLKPGVACSVRVHGDTVITGYVDELDIEHDHQSHGITVRGRDAAGDLVDCSVQHKPGQWNDQDLLTIAQDLIEPFGIKLSSSVKDLGTPFVSFTVEPGQTVFEALDLLARRRGVLITSNGLGGIVLTKPGGGGALKTALVLGQNILAGSMSLSHRQRFSDYYVLGQAQWDDENLGAQCTELSGSAIDAGVSRFRPNVSIYESESDGGAELETRARWQANVNAARAQHVSITVQGWQHSDGIWRPNHLVTVDNSLLRLKKRQLLISSVNYLLDESGTRTVLTLAPQNAFLVDVPPDALVQ